MFSFMFLLMGKYNQFLEKNIFITINKSKRDVLINKMLSILPPCIATPILVTPKKVISDLGTLNAAIVWPYELLSLIDLTKPDINIDHHTPINPIVMDNKGKNNGLLP